MTIEWTRFFTPNDLLNASDIEVETLLVEREFIEDQVDSSQNISSYRSVLTTSENDTINTVIYRCTATTLNYSSFSDTAVHVEAIRSKKDIFSSAVSLSVDITITAAAVVAYTTHGTSTLSIPQTVIPIASSSLSTITSLSPTVSFSSITSLSTVVTKVKTVNISEMLVSITSTSTHSSSSIVLTPTVTPIIKGKSGD